MHLTLQGGNPNEAIFSTTNVYAGVRSQVLCYKTNTGTIRVDYRANSSTAVTVETGVVCNATLNEGDSQFFQVGVSCTGDGGFANIYINGVLAATAPITGMVPSTFNNAVNGIVFGQRQTAAATYDFSAMLEAPEFLGFGGIALGPTELNNLSLNIGGLRVAA